MSARLLKKGDLALCKGEISGRNLGEASLLKQVALGMNLYGRQFRKIQFLFMTEKKSQAMNVEMSNSQNDQR